LFGEYVSLVLFRVEGMNLGTVDVQVISILGPLAQTNEWFPKKPKVGARVIVFAVFVHRHSV